MIHLFKIKPDNTLAATGACASAVIMLTKNITDAVYVVQNIDLINNITVKGSYVTPCIYSAFEN